MTETAASPARGKSSATVASVFVVDDAAYTRTRLGEILTAAGFAVIAEAADGAEAVSMYREMDEGMRPDLVTMDIAMPKLDGIQAVEQLMQIDPEVRVVMCSALGQDSAVIAAIGAGAVDFVVKPFTPEQVVEALHNALD